MNNVVLDSNGRRVRALHTWDPMRLVDDFMMWQPPTPVRVRHDDAATTVTVDMPGVDPCDLDLTFERGGLSIVGKRGDHVHRYAVDLGDKIDPDAIRATLDKGVLTVRAGIRSGAKPRKILVAAGTSPGEAR